MVAKSHEKIDPFGQVCHHHKMFRRISKYLKGMSEPPLGRWCLKDKTKNNWKIDTANTDHCGTCRYEHSNSLPVMKFKEGSSPVSLSQPPGMDKKMNALK
jgi:hypothetical protein